MEAPGWLTCSRHPSRPRKSMGAAGCFCSSSLNWQTRGWPCPIICGSMHTCCLRRAGGPIPRSRPHTANRKASVSMRSQSSRQAAAPRLLTSRKQSQTSCAVGAAPFLAHLQQPHKARPRPIAPQMSRPSRRVAVRPSKRRLHSTSARSTSHHRCVALLATHGPSEPSRCGSVAMVAVMAVRRILQRVPLTVPQHAPLRAHRQGATGSVLRVKPRPPLSIASLRSTNRAPECARPQCSRQAAAPRLLTSRKQSQTSCAVGAAPFLAHLQQPHKARPRPIAPQMSRPSRRVAVRPSKRRLHSTSARSTSHHRCVALLATHGPSEPSRCGSGPLFSSAAAAVRQLQRRP